MRRFRPALPALLALAAGYLLLALGEATAAPVLLVLGYLVLVPLAMLRVDAPARR
jgi:hypothetical protein